MNAHQSQELEIVIGEQPGGVTRTEVSFGPENGLEIDACDGQSVTIHTASGGPSRPTAIEMTSDNGRWFVVDRSAEPDSDAVNIPLSEAGSVLSIDQKGVVCARPTNNLTFNFLADQFRHAGVSDVSIKHDDSTGKVTVINADDSSKPIEVVTHLPNHETAVQNTLGSTSLY